MIRRIGHIVAQCLDKRPVRQRHVFIAQPKKDGRALTMRRSRHLARKPRLTDARFACEQDNAPLSRLRGGPRLGQGQLGCEQHRLQAVARLGLRQNPAGIRDPAELSERLNLISYLNE